jgi:alkanesulfonate monooxygenase
MKIFWFIPTHGDSRYLGTQRRPRGQPGLHPAGGRAADSLGYEAC